MNLHNARADSPSTPPQTTLIFFRKEAKRLQRSAQSRSLAQSLPVLRRLIKTQVFTHISLPELRRQQMSIKRKHLLNMLAVEVGFDNWNALKLRFVHSSGALSHPRTRLLNAGYPNRWFADVAAADAYAALHGGEVIEVGQQAVILTK